MNKSGMELFTIKQADLWGDYGDVLISGFCQKKASDSPALLERAGPFLPPISFPSRTIIVSDSFKFKLEAAMNDSSIPRIHFRKAVLDKIVPIDWHLWDRKAESPKKYPVEGEPENYLYEGKHSPDTAGRMESAWEIIVPEFPCVFEESFINSANSHKVSHPKTLYVDSTVYPCLFNTGFYGSSIINDSLKNWLQIHVAEWVKFYPLIIVHDPTAAQRLMDQRDYNERIGPHLTDEEYRTRAFELCQKNLFAIPAGFDRSNFSASRYCVVLTDVNPHRLCAKLFDSYGSLEDYILYKQRVSIKPEKVLSNILIYDLESGKQMKYLGNQKFTSAGDK
jgi:hypothetical protein